MNMATDATVDDLMAKKQKDRIRLSEHALKSADAAALKNLYDQAEKDVTAIVGALSVMARNDKIGSRPSNDAIMAMRDVALASIELAKMVATKEKE